MSATIESTNQQQTISKYEYESKHMSASHKQTYNWTIHMKMYKYFNNIPKSHNSKKYIRLSNWGIYLCVPDIGSMIYGEFL